MVAALSPADINYDETLSTLRYVLQGVHVLPCFKLKTPAKGGSFREHSLGREASSNCSGVPGYLWAMYYVILYHIIHYHIIYMSIYYPLGYISGL
jgi:hypothetical protein